MKTVSVSYLVWRSTLTHGSRFIRSGRAIEETAPGEGRRIDAYLQLKTCPSEAVRAKILIDSPGFDADAQRTSTLRITNHIVDLSDLVLVFFDARTRSGHHARYARAPGVADHCPS
jgi:hypothetical protein